MSVDLTIEAIATATGAQVLRPGAVDRVLGVSIDSRTVGPGQAFFALGGERFDGHRFCRQAAAAGAALLVVERFPFDDQGALPPGPAVLLVPGVRLALGQLARAWRRSVGAQTVAITGSVGKTTTKELTARLLARLGATHCTPGNFNNEVGLPLTLLSMPAASSYLVAELGMNALGEIAYLTGLVEPQVGVITCVAPVHLEGLGTLEAVAAAKGELLEGLDPERAWAVVPGHEPLLASALRAVAPQRRVRFGAGEADEVRILRVQGQGAAGSRVRLSLRGQEVDLTLPLVGAHNVKNAAAAAGAAMVLGLAPAEIARELERGPAELKHRSSLIDLGGWHVLDDCYNANPVAVRAAVDTLGELAGDEERLVVLGEMRELGAQAERYHLEVGGHCGRAGLRLLVTVGTAAGAVARGAREAGMDPARIVEVEGAQEAVEALVRGAGARAWILVKASRGARLERVVEGLVALRSGGARPDEERRGQG